MDFALRLPQADNARQAYLTGSALVQGEIEAENAGLPPIRVGRRAAPLPLLPLEPDPRRGRLHRLHRRRLHMLGTTSSSTAIRDTSRS